MSAMWRRFLVSLLVACASLVLLGSLPGSAHAQAPSSVYSTTVGQPAGLDEVALLFRDNAVPPRIYGIDGPDTLRAGEEGRFTARANSDVASLPLDLRWTFGDGATAEGLYALHRYTEPGTYTVAFAVRNAFGKAEDGLRVTVVPACRSSASGDACAPGDSDADTMK